MSNEPQIGEQWEWQSTDPFVENHVVTIIDKKNGYVQYTSDSSYRWSDPIDSFVRHHRKVPQ